MKQNKYIILVAGDPNSINTEIIFKSWSKCKDSIKKKIVIVGSFDLIKKQLKKLNYNIKISQIKSLNDPHKQNILKIQLCLILVLIKETIIKKSQIMVGVVENIRVLAVYLQYMLLKLLLQHFSKD